MFCSVCGFNNESTNAVCASCGAALVSASSIAAEPKKNKGLLVGLSIGGGAVVLGGLALVAALVFGKTASLVPALEACGLDEFTDGVTLDASGKSVYFDGFGNEDYNGILYSDVKCVLTETGAPPSVFDRIGNTSALQGLVSGEWDNFSASWTYHPDNGLDLSLSIK